MNSTLFMLFLASAVAISPVLALGFCWLFWRWITAPLRRSK
ncbi:hypothetical protein AB0L20_32165 [Streptomyces albidoflavus]